MSWDLETSTVSRIACCVTVRHRRLLPIKLLAIPHPPAAPRLSTGPTASDSPSSQRGPFINQLNQRRTFLKLALPAPVWPAVTHYSVLPHNRYSISEV
ncbi:hypothetical protein BDZ91DRAFT_710090, partial [Kalaharituber pfeilii]